MFPSRDALAAAAAERFAAAAEEAIAARGRFVVALSGGTTPRQLYERLAAEPHAAVVDWPRVHVFWTDERAVPPEHPASNYRMARDALLARVPLRPELIHRIHGEADPEVAAAEYERTLRATFDTPTGPPRSVAGARFDLVLLGLGEDGHTASLFPGRASIHERVLWAIADWVPATPAGRVTLTPPVLAAAADLLFLVTGREKAAALRRVLRGPSTPDLLPAQVVARRNDCVRFLVDAESAAELEPKGNSER